MQIYSEQQGQRGTLRPCGRIDSTTAGALDLAVASLVDAGVTVLVLDFSQIDYVSSAGLRSTLIAGKKMRGQGQLLLCGLNAHVHEVFAQSGFVSLFQIYPDVESAYTALA